MFSPHLAIFFSDFPYDYYTNTHEFKSYDMCLFCPSFLPVNNDFGVVPYTIRASEWIIKNNLSGYSAL